MIAYKKDIAGTTKEMSTNIVKIRTL